MDRSQSPSPSFSRRRVLSLAASGDRDGRCRQSRAANAAQVTPVASPVAEVTAAGTPVPGAAALPPMPMPSSLAADASPQFKAVCEALVAAMQQNGVPGAAIGLLAGGREEHATFGVESLSSLRPVMAETLFQIGSLSKTFTGTAIWRLIDEGALALDAPVRDYLPDFTLMDAEVAAAVTVRNLLDHSGGFYGDEGFETGDGDDAIARYVAERAPQLPQIFPLGEFFSYNNAGFSILGRLIEVVTGTPYNAAMASLLLGPLGLENSLLDREAFRNRPFADGHVATVINGKPAVAVQTPLLLPRAVDPAGGIWSTTRDVIRYGRFHMDAGTIPSDANIVHPDSLLQMREPSMPILGTTMHMGLDWFVQDVQGTRVFCHGGDMIGQHTDFFGFPRQQFALVVLTNGQGGGAVATVAALDAALGQFPDMAPLVGKVGLSHAFMAPADATPIELTPEQLTDYAGRYADLGQALTVSEKDGGLEALVETIVEPGAATPTIVPPPPPPFPVAFLAEDMAVLGPALVPFVRDAEGSVAWVSFGLRLVPRV